jgi:hypothetical protein
MGFITKIIVIFWSIWIIWYLTGGPLRDDKNKKYIGPAPSGELEYFGTTTTPYSR